MEARLQQLIECETVSVADRVGRNIGDIYGK